MVQSYIVQIFSMIINIYKIDFNILNLVSLQF